MSLPQCRSQILAGSELLMEHTMRIPEYKVVELTADIKNPSADRRVKNDWVKEAVIKKGTRFVVQPDWDFPDRLQTVTLLRGQWTYQRISASGSNKLGTMIIEASREVPENEYEYEDVIGVCKHVFYNSPEGILRDMCDENPMLLRALLPFSSRAYERDQTEMESDAPKTFLVHGRGCEDQSIERKVLASTEDEAKIKFVEMIDESVVIDDVEEID